MSLLTYANDNGIHEYSEAVGLGFMDFKFGFKLEGFFGTLPKNVSMTLHHLMILWHYQQYGTVEFITRGKKKPFACPACFQKEYDAFLAYCEQKKYTMLGPSCYFKPGAKISQHFWIPAGFYISMISILPSFPHSFPSTLTIPRGMSLQSYLPCGPFLNACMTRAIWKKKYGICCQK